MLCRVGQVRPGRFQAIDGLLNRLRCHGAARHGVPVPQVEGDGHHRTDAIFLQPLESLFDGRPVGQLLLVQALSQSAKSVSLIFEDGRCRSRLPSRVNKASYVDLAIEVSQHRLLFNPDYQLDLLGIPSCNQHVLDWIVDMDAVTGLVACVSRLVREMMLAVILFSPPFPTEQAKNPSMADDMVELILV